MRAAAVVLGLALPASCQSNPEPPPLAAASETPSPSPASSPSPEAPTLPPEAKGRSEAAAKAFVRHYFESLNHAMTTGETRHLRSLAGPGCDSCEAIAGNIEETYDAGGRIESDGWLLRSISQVPGQPAKSPILDIGVVMRPEKVTKAAGAEPQSFEGGRQAMTIYLAYRRSSWSVTRLDRVA